MVCKDVEGAKRKITAKRCGFMSQGCSCLCTVLAATLTYFIYLCEVNKVTTPPCPYVGLPRVTQSVVWASWRSPCPRLWVSVCAWTGEGGCCLRCGPRACQCAGSFSPLSPKGSLDWFCVQSLCRFQWQWDVSQGPLNCFGSERAFSSVQLLVHHTCQLARTAWLKQLAMV